MYIDGTPLVLKELKEIKALLVKLLEALEQKSN